MNRKIYDKFKNNNLPTPFWDKEREVLEYVYFKDQKDIYVNNSIFYALSDIACTGLYYPFDSKGIHMWKENGEYVKEEVIGHSHAHSFEEVVRELYNYPETFKIIKEDEIYYSKQELEYLRKVQKYLLFIGLKDIDMNKKSITRYRNKIYAKYSNSMVFMFKNKQIKEILDGKINYRVGEYYTGNIEDKEYKKGEYTSLIVDEEENFIMFIEYTKREVKLYKDVKKYYKNNKLKDNDKVVVYYFNILEKF